MSFLFFFLLLFFKQEKIVYLHRPHNIQWTVFLQFLSIRSRSPPADHRSLLWQISAGCLAPSCAGNELLHIFPHELPRPWNVDHWSTVGKLLIHLPIWRKNVSWMRAVHWNSHLGQMKVNSLMMIFDPQCRVSMITWFRAQPVQPQQHRPAASSDKGNVHFNMTALVYVWYLYFYLYFYIYTKRSSVLSSTQLLLTTTYFTGSWGQKSHQVITTFTHTLNLESPINQMCMFLDKIPQKTLKLVENLKTPVWNWTQLSLLLRSTLQWRSWYRINVLSFSLIWHQLDWSVWIREDTGL